jgi:hypothetical protein
MSRTDLPLGCGKVGHHTTQIICPVAQLARNQEDISVLNPGTPGWARNI